MANKTSREVKFWLDNASGTLTEITSWINSASVQSTMGVLEDTALSDTERSYLPDVASATVPISGFVNSTIEAIIDPLIGKMTSVTKTFQYYDGIKYLYGEGYPTDVQKSGAVGSLQTFSLTLTVDGAVNRTSVAQG